MTTLTWRVGRLRKSTPALFILFVMASSRLSFSLVASNTHRRTGTRFWNISGKTLTIRARALGRQIKKFKKRETKHRLSSPNIILNAHKFCQSSFIDSWSHWLMKNLSITLINSLWCSSHLGIYQIPWNVCDNKTWTVKRERSTVSENSILENMHRYVTRKIFGVELDDLFHCDFFNC